MKFESIAKLKMGQTKIRNKNLKLLMVNKTNNCVFLKIKIKMANISLD